MEKIHAYNPEFRWYVLGALSRLIEALVNSGDYPACQTYMEMMVNTLNKEEYLNQKSLIYEKEQDNLACNMKFKNYVSAQPAYLSKFLYLFAVWMTNYKLDYELGYQFFSSAYEILKREQALTQFFSNECLIETAKRNMNTCMEFIKNKAKNRKHGYTEDKINRTDINAKKKAKVMVFSFDAPSQACASIRILHPLSFLKDNIEVHWCVGHNGKSFVANENLIIDADMIIIQRAFPCKETMSIIQKCLNSGKPVIYEIDDNLFEIPKSNPNFYLRRNQAYFLQLIEKCHAVTVSTDLLKYKFLNGKNKIYVLPNFINDKIWKFDKKSYNNKKKLTIGYAGSITHGNDLRQIELAVRQIITKYNDNVNFKFFGCATNFLENECNVDCIQFESEYKLYAQKLQKLDIDLMVVPLEDNEFNRCKSNIKWLEISSCGIPAIYSDLPPYNNSVKHLQNGMLVKDRFQEWFNAMEYLIENPDIRKSIGLKAQLDVMKEHRMSQRADVYLKAFQEIGMTFLGINVS